MVLNTLLKVERVLVPRVKPEDDGVESGMTGYVYMMSDKPRGVLYIGVTSDLRDRVWDHKNGTYKGFAKKYQTKNLVWFETHPNIVLAIKREKSLKRYLRDWKIELVESLNPTWLDLDERIDEIENVYSPHPGTAVWTDYH